MYSHFSICEGCLIHLSLCVLIWYRSSHRRFSVKKGVLRNFAKFTGKQLCQSLLLKKESLAQVFSCEFFEISKNTFSTEHLRTTASAGTFTTFFIGHRCTYFKEHEDVAKVFLLGRLSFRSSSVQDFLLI